MYSIMRTQPRNSIQHVYLRLHSLVDIIMPKVRKQMFEEWDPCQEFSYNECTMRPCVQCGECYPCDFPDSEPFQCDACSRLIFDDTLVSTLEACFNLAEFLKLYTYTSKLCYCREKIDWYTDGSYDKQRTMAGLNNFECMQIRDDPLDYVEHYWGLSPVALQFTQNTTLNISTNKIASLYFQYNNHFGNWEDVMALPVPCYARLDQQNNQPFALRLDSARIYQLLQPRNRLVCQHWLFGTNDNEWRKQIVKSINFDHNMNDFYSNKFVEVINPHVDCIDDLVKLLYDFVFDEYEGMFISLDMDIMDNDQYVHFYFEYFRRVWWCSECASDGANLTINFLKHATIALFDKHNATYH